MIGIPAGVQIFAWLATIFVGRPVWKTPFLFVIGFLVMFVLGGITGIMVAAVPFDAQAHDSYFVVGHLHYVLIGGVIFPIFAGFYYWFPKFTGKMFSEQLGRWHAGLLFVGANVTFFPMHIVGLMGMPRRVHTYPAGFGWGIYNLISTIGVFIMVAAIAVFAVNVWRSLRHGPPAGPDPWGADTLEWSIPSPPLQHGFTTPVVVRSRHPLWDQDDLLEADERVERVTRALARWPLDWRANLTVTSADARPEEVVRIAGPSIWPLVGAVGAVTVFAAELMKLRLGALAGIAILVVAVVRWNWPQPVGVTAEERENFEREAGIPVAVGGSASIDRWAMGLGLLFAAVAFASFLLAYFYLRLENAVWPPAGHETPSVSVAVYAGAVMLAGTAAVIRARSRAAERDRTGQQAWLATGLAASIAGCWILARDLVGLEFDSMTHAYGSIFHAFGGYLLVLGGAAALVTAMVLWWSKDDRFGPNHHSAVVNAYRYWIGMSIMWVAGLATLYVTPYLT